LGLSRRMPPAEPALPASGVRFAAFLEREALGAGVVVVLRPGEDVLEAIADVVLDSE
jgi:hypothetical protein